jgi:DNA-binding transcriptional ArsR family regulator
MTRPAVSKHLKILHTAGFISIEDVGRERHCKLNPKGFEDLHQWIGYFDQFWQTKMANLDNLLNEKYKK